MERKLKMNVKRKNVGQDFNGSFISLNKIKVKNKKHNPNTYRNSKV